MPIDSLRAVEPVPTRNAELRDGHGGRPGKLNQWIVPASGASGGAKYFGESSIARSPWYVSWAMTFLRLPLPSGASITYSKIQKRSYDN